MAVHGCRTFRTLYWPECHHEWLRLHRPVTKTSRLRETGHRLADDVHFEWPPVSDVTHRCSTRCNCLPSELLCTEHVWQHPGRSRW
jgi:hypothetical protein